MTTDELPARKLNGNSDSGKGYVDIEPAFCPMCGEALSDHRCVNQLCKKYGKKVSIGGIGGKEAYRKDGTDYPAVKKFPTHGTPDANSNNPKLKAYLDKIEALSAKYPTRAVKQELYTLIPAANAELQAQISQFEEIRRKTVANPAITGEQKSKMLDDLKQVSEILGQKGARLDEVLKDLSDFEFKQIEKERNSVQVTMR